MSNARNILFFIFLLTSSALFAESCPAHYYDRIEGASDSILKGRLKAIIRNHTVVPYGSGSNSSWKVFYYADQDSNGYCMDMYCDNWQKFGSPGSVVSGCNVEHSFAKSWWGEAENDAYKDCYHLNPSNSTANGSRSNYPPGIPVKDFKDKSSTGSLRVGKRHHVALNEDHFVFEPKDEYKGDFARAYFYMATCYGRDSLGNQVDLPKTSKKNYVGWRIDNKDVGSRYGMQNNDYLEFQDWLIDVLLDWHRKDPVSKKELDRMNAVSDFQHNRNPFIEYPCLVEYIWGNRKGQAVHLSSLKKTTAGDWLSLKDSLQLTGCQCEYDKPVLQASVKQLTFPAILAQNETSLTFHLIYALLPNKASLQITGGDASLFEVSTTEIAATEQKYVDSLITVTYRPKDIGSHTATLVIACEGVDTLTIALTGRCTELVTVTWLVDGVPTTSGDPTTSLVAGDTIRALPTAPASCSTTSETFMGWTDMPIGTKTDEAPANLYTKPIGMPAVEQDMTYYAVFAHHSQTGGGTGETLSYSGSEKDWTAQNMKSASGYQVLQTGASISSPVLDGSSLQKITMTLRTYGGDSYNTASITFNETELGQLKATSKNLTEYTLTISSAPKGTGSVVFTSPTSGKEKGVGVSKITITKSGVKHTYSAYTTSCSTTDLNSITNHPSPITKILRDGHLYILRNGVVYTINGQPIKNF